MLVRIKRWRLLISLKSAADEVSKKVRSVVIGRNGEIVSAALALNSYCLLCNFAAHRDEFEELLTLYTHLKQLMHRLRQSHVVRSRRWWRLDSCSSTETESLVVRGKLSKIWPCQACFIEYNPTHRGTLPPSRIRCSGSSSGTSF